MKVSRVLFDATMGRLQEIAVRVLICVVAVIVLSAAAPQSMVVIEKPKPRTTNGGACRIVASGTLSGIWGPTALPTLAFTIGPASAMADVLHAKKTPYTGPGTYPDVIIAVYLGKTALEDTYAGLGTVTINADGHTGSFKLNDGSAAGHFDCGTAPTKG